MKTRVGLSIGAVLASVAGAAAANIYVISSGDVTTDSAVMTALTAGGHTVTLGVPYTAFDGSVNLSGFQTVYLQANADWTSGPMPAGGQQQLVDWANAGGRLVTSEWVIYYTYIGGGNFEIVGPVIPAEQSFNYGGQLSTTYDVVTPDPAINAGLPSSFTFPLTSYTGTETYTVAKPGAVTYYTTSSSPASCGLVGWSMGSGSVFSFTSTCGPDQVGDPNFARLLSNVMGTSAGGGCYANCDHSTASPILNVNDFICFQAAFAAGASYANCDNSTAPPVLNVNDFICFQQRFAAGCQ